MNDDKRIYVTDVDDHGEPLDGLYAVTDSQIYRVELAPGAVYLSADGERRYKGRRLVPVGEGTEQEIP